MTTMYTIILLVYVIAMLGIGFFGAKKSETSEDYILAGRQLPAWMMAFSVVAGFFGSEVAMGASGTAYTMGWIGGAGIPLGWSVCLLVMAFCFTGKMRGMRLYNISDFFEIKYGSTVGVLSSILIAIGQLFWIAALNIGIAKTLAAFLGWNYYAAIGIGLVVVLIYTVSGGLWSGVITDVIQFIILGISTIILAVVAVSEAGGWGNITAVVPKEQMSFSIKDTSTLLFAIGGFFSPIFSGVVTPDGNSRLMGGKSVKASIRAALLSSPLYFVLGIACMIIGFAGVVVYPAITDAELIYPSFAIDYLPSFLSALVMIGLVSVVMSSADSAILASATLLTRNVIGPLKKEKMSDRETLKLVRLMVVVCGILSLVIAFLSAEIENAMVVLNMLTAGIWLALAPLIWYGFFWKKANKTAGLVTTVFSCIFLLIWYSISTFINPSIGSISMSDLGGELIAAPVGMIIFYITAKLTSDKDKPVEITEYAD